MFAARMQTSSGSYSCLSFEEMAEILSKSDKGVSPQAKKLGVEVGSLRKYLADHIKSAYRVSEQSLRQLQQQQQQQQSDHHGGATMISNLIELVNLQKAMLDIVIPATQHTATLPLSRLFIGPDFEAHIFNMTQGVHSQFAIFKAGGHPIATSKSIDNTSNSSNSNNDEEPMFRPAVGAITRETRPIDSTRRANLNNIIYSVFKKKEEEEEE